MKEYNILQSIFMSFYSRNLYRDVAKNWRGSILLYLLLLLSICWAVVMPKIQLSIDQGATEFTNKYITQIPSIDIKNGEIKTPEDRPYNIRNPNSNEIFAIIDTQRPLLPTNNPSAEDHSVPNSVGSSSAKVTQTPPLLVTKTAIIYYDNNNIQKIQVLPSSLNMHIEPLKVKAAIEHYMQWLWIILLPLFVLFSFMYRLLQAVFYAVIAKLFTLAQRPPLSFGQLWKLVIVANTPALILATLLDFNGVIFKGEMLVFILVTVFYIVFAVRANRAGVIAV